MERLYSVSESAEILRIAKCTVWAWLKSGRIRGAKIGDRRVIRESELQRLIVDDARPAKAESK